MSGLAFSFAFIEEPSDKQKTSIVSISVEQQWAASFSRCDVYYGLPMLMVRPL